MAGRYPGVTHRRSETSVAASLSLTPSGLYGEYQFGISVSSGKWDVAPTPSNDDHVDRSPAVAPANSPNEPGD